MRDQTTQNIRIVLTVLLMISAALFLFGVRTERSSRHSESAAHVDAAASTEHSGETSPEAAPSQAEPKHSESGERLAGIDLESTPVVETALLTATLLALGLWIAPGFTSIVLALIVGFGLASTVLDVREAIHQNTEGRDSIVVISSVVALLHLTTAVLASTMLRISRVGSS